MRIVRFKVIVATQRMHRGRKPLSCVGMVADRLSSANHLLIVANGLPESALPYIFTIDCLPVSASGWSSMSQPAPLYGLHCYPMQKIPRGFGQRRYSGYLGVHHHNGRYQRAI